MNLLNIIVNTLVFFGGITIIFLIGSYLIYKAKTRNKDFVRENLTQSKQTEESVMPVPTSTKENIIHTVALPDADTRGIFPIAVPEMVAEPIPAYQNTRIPRYQVVNSSSVHLNIWKSVPNTNRKIAFR